ncbi:MAG TPA: tyrosine-type recombinase/integrase [Bacteroidales bacterium]|jgi:integrase/recombinase XerC|nr:tyrosine-type recombinase/integrase [Bacteroidales bacterium]HOS57071.1 tyrosine-type recombinase/integrase [Bacteroidales bacterium]HRR03667.1 tyrosine-type recombinase/integrase [Bacteroidales bacterium]
MDVITQFLNYLQFEKRLSKHTVIAYEQDIKQFFTFYLQNLFEKEKDDISTTTVIAYINKIDINEIQGAAFRTWIVELIDSKITPRSVNRKISALKAFYHYHHKMGRVQTNPLSLVQGMKTSKKLPVYVEQNDMKNLFSLDVFPDTFEGCRDRTILELFYATGMRLSELINLKYRDVDLYESTVKVLGKRNKERIIPFGDTMKKAFNTYFSCRKEKFGELNNEDFIFVTSTSNKLYPKAVYRIVKKYIQLVSNMQQVSPHTLRHTFATHLLNKGADINAIKEILGHTSLAATQVYTHNSIEKLKSIYKQAHPRA